jgi:hypothetical protein
MTLTQKHLTYDIGSGQNDKIVTHEYGNGEYDTEEDGYPVIHMVSGIDEGGTPRVFLVQRFRDGELEVYLPATDKDMTTALDDWFAA